MSRAVYIVGIVGRGVLWLLCAFVIAATYAKHGGRAYPFTWGAAAVTVVPLAIRALVALVRHRAVRTLSPPQSVYRTPAASREPPRRVDISAQLVIDTLIPVAFIACTMALGYDPSEPEHVKVCCCAPC